MAPWEHGPNSCLGSIEHAPFFTLEMRVGLICMFAGLATDALGRVLNSANESITGLYAVGNDQASVFGGFYPDPDRRWGRE